MHCCKNISRWLVRWGLLLLIAHSSVVIAQENPVLMIKNANFIEDNAHYRLLTSVAITFGPSLKAALVKGFKLSYVLEFQLFRPRKYWFDDEVVTIAKPSMLSYNAIDRKDL